MELYILWTMVFISSYLLQAIINYQKLRAFKSARSSVLPLLDTTIEQLSLSNSAVT